MSSAPAFRQLADELRARIAAGELPPGGQLPSMTQLREQHGVSSTVVRDALNELRRDGLIVGRQGKGVYVSEDVSAAARRPDDTQSRLDRLEDAVRTLTKRVDDLAGGRE